MPTYYVNDHVRPDGDHEVHRAGCLHLPYVESKTSLGYFRNHREAAQAAQEHYPRVNCCETCLPEGTALQEEEETTSTYAGSCK